MPTNRRSPSIIDVIKTINGIGVSWQIHDPIDVASNHYVYVRTYIYRVDSKDGDRGPAHNRYYKETNLGKVINVLAYDEYTFIPIINELADFTLQIGINNRKSGVYYTPYADNKVIQWSRDEQLQKGTIYGLNISDRERKNIIEIRHDTISIKSKLGFSIPFKSTTTDTTCTIRYKNPKNQFPYDYIGKKLNLGMNKKQDSDGNTVWHNIWTGYIYNIKFPVTREEAGVIEINAKGLDRLFNDGTTSFPGGTFLYDDDIYERIINNSITALYYKGGFILDYDKLGNGRVGKTLTMGKDLPREKMVYVPEEKDVSITDILSEYSKVMNQKIYIDHNGSFRIRTTDLRKYYTDEDEDELRFLTIKDYKDITYEYIPEEYTFSKVTLDYNEVADTEDAPLLIYSQGTTSYPARSETEVSGEFTRNGRNVIVGSLNYPFHRDLGGSRYLVITGFEATSTSFKMKVTNVANTAVSSPGINIYGTFAYYNGRKTYSKLSDITTTFIRREHKISTDKYLTENQAHRLVENTLRNFEQERGQVIKMTLPVIREEGKSNGLELSLTPLHKTLINFNTDQIDHKQKIYRIIGSEETIDSGMQFHEISVYLEPIIDLEKHGFVSRVPDDQGSIGTDLTDMRTY